MEHSDDEEIQLTHDQMEKLAQLQDLTGIEDTSVCRALLESNRWDLEQTAREHLGIPLQPHPHSENHPAEVEVVEEVNENNAPNRVAERRPNNVFSLLWYILSLPIRAFSFGYETIGSFVFSLMGFPPRRTETPRNPLAEVRSFHVTYEARYGTAHPPFFEGSYSQVLEEAKKELKFLLVYLHSEDHQDTDHFCRHTLSNTRVIQYVRENMLFWGCSVRQPEGHKVSEALREHSYPFLAVIVLRQHRMVVVGRNEGLIAPDDLIGWLEKTVREYEAFIVAARAERDERNYNREIRSEQEAAFAETLRQDQEKEQERLEQERKRLEEEAKQREEEERERQRQEEENRKKEEIARMKIDLVDQIPEEPEAGSSDSIRILIKLPGGQRLERRFLLSHTLKDVYYFVFCHPESPDEFDIMTNYPRRILPCRPSEQQPETPTLSEAGFQKSEMLFVHDLNA